MKKISVLIPCYNEVENVEPMSSAVVKVMEEALSHYDYEIIFIDNCSTDGTREKLGEICLRNKKIKAIFNITNFGQFNSPSMGCVRPQEIAQFLCAVTFRIQWSLSRSLWKSGKRGIKLSVVLKQVVRKIR